MKTSISIEVSRLGSAVEVVAAAASREELLESFAIELNALLDGTATVISCLEGNVLHEAASSWPDDIPPDKRFAEYGYLLDDYPATKASLRSRRPYSVSLA
ncbi:MAG: hypothetical protein LC790_18415, partial [Actinobacteria bacterium]|nr:hypothetical protein [Actinomycetota bacterium]